MTERKPPALRALIAGMKGLHWIGLAIAVVVTLLVLL